jgi:hypothetical protein
MGEGLTGTCEQGETIIRVDGCSPQQQRIATGVPR